MKLDKIALDETDCFSDSFLKYIQDPESLKSFYNLFPRIENFPEQIKNRNFPQEHRSVLNRVLVQQYEGYETSDSVQENIDLLKDSKTFTITTGHQLNIFTGPLYFIYKIITVIRACQELKKSNPDFNFVPVYWMASEDHDFEEISYFRYQGKKYQWSTLQTGAVGRFVPHELKAILDEFPAHLELFEQAYLKHDNLADSVRYYVNELFGEYGVVVVDADHKDLKELLVPVIESDIFDNSPEEKVNQTLPLLAEKGIQAQVNPRNINFFYLEDSLRTRIEKSGDTFRLVDTDREFSEDKLRDLIKSNPERFSPNVILRPLYQEIILPNLAYVGGPAEVVYWLELKRVFDHFDVPFPMVMPRNFGMLIPAHIGRKWSKTGLGIADLFKPLHTLSKEITLRDSENDLLLNGKTDQVKSVFAEIQKQAFAIDSTLGPMVEAETVRAMKSLAKIEKKMIRAEKRRMSEKTGQIEAVKEFLFPGGGLQERKDNFLNFSLDDPDLIPHLAQAFDPFDYSFHILSYE